MRKSEKRIREKSEVGMRNAEKRIVSLKVSENPVLLIPKRSNFNIVSWPSSLPAFKLPGIPAFQLPHSDFRIQPIPTSEFNLFLYETHSWYSEPQNIEYRMSNIEGWNRFAQSFFK